MPDLIHEARSLLYDLCRAGGLPVPVVSDARLEELIVECGGKGGKPGPCPKGKPAEPKHGRQKKAATAPSREETHGLIAKAKTGSLLSEEDLEALLADEGDALESFAPSATSGDVGIAGRRGNLVEDMLDASVAYGSRVLEGVTRSAVKRLLAAGAIGAQQTATLFTDEEREQLASALAAVNGTADQLGRALLLDYLRIQRERHGESRESAVSEAIGRPAEPLSPEDAIAYFRSLVPQLHGTIKASVSGRPIEFVAHPAAGIGEVLMRVPASAIDAAWQKDQDYYMPPESSGQSEVGGRRESFRDFLRKNLPIESSRVVLGSDGSLSFTDGRHRFAVLRDMGAAEVGVMVPAEQVADFRQLFGGVQYGPSPALFGDAMRRQAFTLAVQTETEVLGRVQASILDRISTGQEIKAAPKLIADILTDAGVTQTVGGRKVDGAYSEMVWRTNALNAYNTAADEERMDPEIQEEFPVWVYHAIDDSRSRPHHAARDQKYYPNSVSFNEVRGTDISEVANCRCTFAPVWRGEWSRLQAAGAQVETSW